MRGRISALFNLFMHERQIEKLNKRIDAAKTAEEKENLISQKFDLIRRFRMSVETPEDRA